MFSDLILVHRPGGHSASSPTASLRDDLVHALVEHKASVFCWQTCLRQIAIVDEASLELARPEFACGDEIHHGDAAYRFLLQVICGLHSPLVGETEVYGQFKAAVQIFSAPATPWGSQLKRFFKVLFEDAKRIRQAALEDLGSQSYGSLLRRELKGFTRVHLLGAGHLASEILPWIAKDGIEIQVHARDPEKARMALASALGEAQISIRALIGDLAAESSASVGPFLAHEKSVVVVAAPIASGLLIRYLESLQPLLVIDLRADSTSDAVRCGEVRVLKLEDVFAQISENKQVIEQRKSAALALIESAVEVLSNHVEYRPFGWEDVCA